MSNSLLGAVTAATGTLGGVGAIGGLGLLVPMEAGIPIPIPYDLVALAIGTRVSAGDIPLWAAVVGFEGVAVIGTALLYLVARGPGHAFVERLGPHVGLSSARLDRAKRLLERRGRVALAVGRGTPGLRTLTVVAAGGSGMSFARAFPALVLGSTVFLQLHLFLGYFLGSSARHVLRSATGPAIAALSGIVAVAVLFWFVRRGRRQGSGGLLEAACPACLALAYVSERQPDLPALARPGAKQPTSDH